MLIIPELLRSDDSHLQPPEFSESSQPADGRVARVDGLLLVQVVQQSVAMVGAEWQTGII